MTRRDQLEDDDVAFFAEIGAWLRSARRRQGLSLAALAEACGLSQSFLSQMERGLLQPSLVSLNRVARALGTTAQQVMALQGSGPTSLVKADEGHLFPDARVLVRGNRRIHPMELTDASPTFGDVFVHVEEEMLYVVHGTIEVEAGDGPARRLGPGDAIYFGPSVPHRWRRLGDGPLRVLKVSEAGHPA